MEPKTALVGLERIFDISINASPFDVSAMLGVDLGLRQLERWSQRKRYSFETLVVLRMVVVDLDCSGVIPDAARVTESVLKIAALAHKDARVARVAGSIVTDLYRSETLRANELAAHHVAENLMALFASAPYESKRKATPGKLLDVRIEPALDGAKRFISVYRFETAAAVCGVLLMLTIRLVTSIQPGSSLPSTGLVVDSGLPKSELAMAARTSASLDQLASDRVPSNGETLTDRELQFIQSLPTPRFGDRQPESFEEFVAKSRTADSSQAPPSDQLPEIKPANP